MPCEAPARPSPWRPPPIPVCHDPTMSAAPLLPHPSLASSIEVVFIGGGNMATALMRGLLRSGRPPACVLVIEPLAAQREHLHASMGVVVAESPSASAEVGQAIGAAKLIVWAVKPQQFKEAAQAFAGLGGQAVHLSVMAGLRIADLASRLGSVCIVRAMPNTPALVGRGMSGLFAAAQVSAEQRALVTALMAPTGEHLWVAQEADLDAVTAISGSGPAYVFYVLEAMIEAGVEMGLPAEQARQLALATLDGATALAAQSQDTPQTLRARVTSKGGTTHAAISRMEVEGVKTTLIAAMRAAQARARELGDELGQ